jgi:enamine deaminase RidA (YjgF/YER057c/UK114 family)
VTGQLRSASGSALDSLVPVLAKRRGDLLFTGGIVALGPDGWPGWRGDVRSQTREVLRTVERLVGQEGGSLDDVVSITSFHADMRSAEDVLEVAREFFPAEPPAWTPVGFLGCEHVGPLVMMRVVAHLGEGSKRSIVPGSQGWLRRYPMAAACEKGGLVFIAGQTAADAEGAVQPLGNHLGQARRAYAHLAEILTMTGGTVDDVLDFTSFHRDIRGAPVTLEAYIPDVIGHLPSTQAATTCHMGTTGLFRAEMLGAYSAIADLSGGRRIGCSPEIVTWNDHGRLPMAGAARKENGKLVTVAGQVASGPNGEVFEPGNPEAQAEFIFEEIRQSLAGLGAAMSDVVEVCSYHKDVRTRPTVMRVASRFFDSEGPPCWTFVGSPGMWLEGFEHEITARAFVG